MANELSWKQLGIAALGLGLTLGAGVILLDEAPQRTEARSSLRVRPLEPARASASTPGRVAAPSERLAPATDSSLLLRIAESQDGSPERVRLLSELKALSGAELRALLATLPDSPEALELALELALALRAELGPEAEGPLRDLIARGLRHEDDLEVCQAALELLHALDPEAFAATLRRESRRAAGMGLVEALVATHRLLPPREVQPFVRGLAAAQLEAADALSEPDAHRGGLAHAAARRYAEDSLPLELLSAIEDDSLPHRERLLAATAAAAAGSLSGLRPDDLGRVRGLLWQEVTRGLSGVDEAGGLDPSAERAQRALAALPGGRGSLVSLLQSQRLGREAAIHVAEVLVAERSPELEAQLLSQLQGATPEGGRNLAYAYHRLRPERPDPRYLSALGRSLERGAPESAARRDLLELLGAHAETPSARTALEQIGASASDPLAERARQLLGQDS